MSGTGILNGPSALRPSNGELRFCHAEILSPEGVLDVFVFVASSPIWRELEPWVSVLGFLPLESAGQKSLLNLPDLVSG